jgi:hypothetical protein
MRRLRVLSEHPHLGKSGDVRDGFEGAQAYIDAGLAEWVVEDRAELVETTALTGPPETAVTRPPVRRQRSRPAPQAPAGPGTVVPSG